MAVFILFAVVSIFFLIIWVNSPGKIKPYQDEEGNVLEGSLWEKVKVEINGTMMGMVIESKDTSNPVLLFVHGGPGMPEYFLTQTKPTHLDDCFTVVWWDQRGAGLSYDSKIDRETMTEGQFIDDVNAVAEYLAKRFGQEKIYLMAHSWGTYLGIQAVEKRPELYEAYLAVGQITNQPESERRAYEYMLKYYTEEGNKSMLKKLQRGDSQSAAYRKIRDAAMHQAGIGTTREMKSVVTDIFFRSLFFKGYTLSEKVNLWRGKIFSQNSITVTKDISKTVTELKVPIYCFSGAYDYTVNYEMAEAYLESLKAPEKEFFLFENSAHSPIFEEPDKVIKIIKDKVLENN